MSRLAMWALLTLTTPTALAWESACYYRGTAACPEGDGFATARARWVFPYDDTLVDWDAYATDHEHEFLWRVMRGIAGIPFALDEPFVLRHFAQNDTVRSTWSGEPVEHPTLAPLRQGAEVAVERTISVPEFAHLPDFSWSLWDWSHGNETCPPWSDEDPSACHLYKSHVSGLNSSHFPPQSRTFYLWYHQLALTRAGECTTVFDAIGDPDGVERHRPYLLACERETMSLEAIALHYLQDTWSTGHMWERWGSAQAFDWEPLAAPEGNVRGVALAVGIYTGLIHGTKSMTTFDDPMTAPTAPGEPHITYQDGSGSGQAFGVGDMFSDFLWDGAIDFELDAQRKAFLGCGANSLRAVYGALPQVHGPMEAFDADAADEDRDPLGDGCWEQRVTNDSLRIGNGIHTGLYPDNLIHLSGLNVVVAALSYFVSRDVDNALTVSQADRYRADMARVNYTIDMMARLRPGDTNLARSGLPSVLGARGNFHYQVTLGTQPAAYNDPEPPYDLGGGEADEILNLVWADAHAADRCDSFDADDLSAYQALSLAAKLAGDGDFRALCGQCEQMVAPHLRFGAEGDHDADREPLCGSIAPETSAFVYYDGDEGGDLSAEDGAAAWCGCATTTLLVGGIGRWSSSTLLFPGLVSLYEAGDDGSLTERASWQLTDGDGLARVDHVAGSDDGREGYAVVRGSLAFFDLTPGAEAEIDLDDDPSTTDPGAAHAGITRLTVAASPDDFVRSLAVVPHRAYALLPIQAYAGDYARDGIAVVNLKARTVERFVTADMLGLGDSPTQERPNRIAVSPDGTRAYLTVYSAPVAPSPTAVLVLDVDKVLAGVEDSSIVAEQWDSYGCSPNAVAVSPKGDRVAVGCYATSNRSVNLIDVDAPVTWNRLLPYDLTGFWRWPVTTLVWSPQSDVLYLGFVGSNRGGSTPAGGAVRACAVGSWLDPSAWGCYAETVVGHPGELSTSVGVRGLGIQGTGRDHVLWVLEPSSALTPLTAADLQSDVAACLDGTGLPEVCDPGPEALLTADASALAGL